MSALLKIRVVSACIILCVFSSETGDYIRKIFFEVFCKIFAEYVGNFFNNFLYVLLNICGDSGREVRFCQFQYIGEFRYVACRGFVFYCKPDIYAVVRDVLEFNFNSVVCFYRSLKGDPESGCLGFNLDFSVLFVVCVFELLYDECPGYI